MTRILQISPYPIVAPRHGGQIRASEIRKHLRQMGCEVLTLSVCESVYAERDQDNDFAVSLDHEPRPFDMPYGAEIQMARLSVSNLQIQQFLSEKIESFSPDFIFFEQPWLWPAVNKILSTRKFQSIKPKIIYSSQNVESHIKAAILRDHFLDEGKISQFVDEVEKLELSLACAASSIICVTPSDATYFSQHSSAAVQICPNGVENRLLSAPELNEVNSFKRGRTYALFAASAHPPNAVGFWKMLGPHLAGIPPSAMIVVVGSVGNILEAYAPPESALYATVNSGVIQKVGQVSDALLAALIWGSSGIIVPITSGGGSNLKTAEAIASGKPVVATQFACRGFEFSSRLSEFHIHDDQARFSEVAVRIARGEILPPSPGVEEKSLRQLVYWDNTLKNVSQALS
jgi:glycosyltransferase involved in cell wall biosynthesis